MATYYAFCGQTAPTPDQQARGRWVWVPNPPPPPPQTLPFTMDFATTSLTPMDELAAMMDLPYAVDPALSDDAIAASLAAVDLDPWGPLPDFDLSAFPAMEHAEPDETAALVPDFLDAFIQAEIERQLAAPEDESLPLIAASPSPRRTEPSLSPGSAAVASPPISSSPPVATADGVFVCPLPACAHLTFP